MSPGSIFVLADTLAMDLLLQDGVITGDQTYTTIDGIPYNLSVVSSYLGEDATAVLVSVGLNLLLCCVTFGGRLYDQKLYIVDREALPRDPEESYDNLKFLLGFIDAGVVAVYTANKQPKPYSWILAR